MTTIIARIRALAAAHPRTAALAAVGAIALLVVLGAFGDGQSFTYNAF